MTPEETRELVAKAAEGILAPDEASTLLDAIRRDPCLLDQVADHITTERLIRAIKSDPDGTLASSEVALRLEQERINTSSHPHFVDGVKTRARNRQWFVRLAGMAALAAFSLLSWWAAVEVTKPEPSHSADGLPSARPSDEAVSVALVKGVSNVVWGAQSHSYSEGELLGPKRLRIESGTLLVVFLSGARVLLVGPSELELVDESHGVLHSGRLTAYVPQQARGFTISTLDAVATDLGTSFGVVSGPKTPTEVHVFDGVVSFATKSSPSLSRPVQAGRALRLEGGVISEFPADPMAFPEGSEMARRQADERASRIQHWRDFQLKLRQDPDLILSYTFEEEPTWDGSVKNHALGTASDGTVVGAGWSGGRWPGKNGLEFRGLGDRLRFEVPGQHKKLTLLAWLRVDSLPNPYNALLMPSRYQPGSIHWNLDQVGYLRFTMRNTSSNRNGAENWEGPVSAKAMTDMDFGLWTLFACTYDTTSGEILLYRDGQSFGQGLLPQKLPAVLSEMEFGNWGVRPDFADTKWTVNQPREWKVRNFVGRLDELTIMGRVLTAAEIARFYEVGKP